MNPAFSVIFFTTLSGAGQGLFVTLALADLSTRVGATPPSAGLLLIGGSVALVLTGLGLLSSFFHLGHPLRAWRAATMWRTSWLSREVIALPLFMACLFGWTASLALGLPGAGLWAWAAGLSCLALWVCTAMIYASLRFLQEWASAYTLVNYILLGLASGATLATALAAVAQPELVAQLALPALLLTLLGMVSRLMSLRRNARLKPRSTLQTALGIRHPRIAQRAQGFMGGSFNTREFFHGRSAALLRHVKSGFVLGAFVVPAAMLLLALTSPIALLPVAAFAVQYVGLLAERWFFFAQANHPQNLYYQVVS
jgi:DMSO reductase anchor subunit